MPYYPEPKIGYYYAECCLHDCHRINNLADLAEVEQRVAENDEFGELMIFRTQEEAVRVLAKGLPGSEVRRHRQRLMDESA